MCIYPEISEVQLKNFKPTRLYIKLHTKTDLLYFGKSVREDVRSYMGSGVYWKSNLQKYGNEYVVTLWVSKWFYDPYELQKFALDFSREKNIVNGIDENGKKIWANLKDEDGINNGYYVTPNNKIDLIEYREDKIKTCEYCGIVIKGNIVNYYIHHGRNCKLNPDRSIESILKNKERVSNLQKVLASNEYREKNKKICPHCNKTIKDPARYVTWHGDNCRFNPNRSNESIVAENEFIKKLSDTRKSEEFKEKHTNTCPYCNKTIRGNPVNYYKHHGDNCKHNPNKIIVEKEEYNCKKCGRSFSYKKRYDAHKNNCE